MVSVPIMLGKHILGNVLHCNFRCQIIMQDKHERETFMHVKILLFLLYLYSDREFD